MNFWMQSSAAEWVELYNANVGSVVRLVTQLCPAMVERGWGRVILLGSFLGPMPQPIVANYSATKAANIAQAVSQRLSYSIHTLLLCKRTISFCRFFEAPLMRGQWALVLENPVRAGSCSFRGRTSLATIHVR